MKRISGGSTNTSSRRSLTQRLGIFAFGVITLLLLVSNTFVYTALEDINSVNNINIVEPNMNTSLFNNTDYATKDEVAVLSYQLSVLQVVVIVNSAIIGLLILLVGALTGIKCMEDYNPDPTVRMEDPFWLKMFSLCNSIIEMLLCQCCACARPKGKAINLFNVDKWRIWHKRDLDLQRGIIEEEARLTLEEELKA
ncbi:hypothetical protein NAEGRDRAFT_80610 [Naegleria gruberi]|uniref:Uncharacterized protein n=1 Tax=Naegleria gruberi TaxID=5762 RepID=D2VN39_NAEGR|nr:uncharacterized protein NAEGRDRAFT_80610 [Naegleria gruberi]EFC41928.1 hypothetical protein NAEGRDRAFT_80610 [Naegleria gruberi]|eukprot:XP_002674672.1 hypothetical protein NAEGRDRAFT_80610 [Naegleria gruberi strain NEG-M]